MIKRILNWLLGLFKSKESPAPPVKIEIKPTAEKTAEQKLMEKNKKMNENGYIYCHKCGRSTGLYRMSMHKRIIVKGKKKIKVYFCGGCVK